MWSKQPYKKDVFKVYEYWVNLPDYLKGLRKDVLVLTYKIDDPYLLKLMQIGTQTEFARRFGVKDLGTLTDWNKRIVRKPQHEHPAVKILMREALASLYIRLLQHGRAKDFKLFAWYVEGWYPGINHGKRPPRNMLTSRQKRSLNLMLARSANRKVARLDLEKFAKEQAKKYGWNR